jgi:hypothetical protein
MLSISYGYAYPRRFSEACERRMDADISEQAPWMSELLVLAMALASLAWLTLVLGLRWQLRTKAALPGLATLVTAALAGAVALGDAKRGEDHPLLAMLPVAIEWSAVVALAAILAWQPHPHRRQLGRTSEHRIPHGGSHRDLCRPDRDHDPTRATERRRW